MNTWNRIDSYRLSTLSGLTLFAGDDVQLDQKGLLQAASMGALVHDTHALSRQGWFGPDGADVNRIIFTPDMSAGPSVPVGTVVESDGVVWPGLIGRDIHCGVSLVTTDMAEGQIAGDTLDRALRHGFFEGGRDLPLDAVQRANLLLHGPLTPSPREDGLWGDIHDLGATAAAGGYAAHRGGLDTLGDFVQGSGAHGRDGQIGSIGGGNHFVEISCIDEILDRHQAYAFGLKRGQVVVLVHSGSVAVGTSVGNAYMDKARAMWPMGQKRPGLCPLPLRGPQAHVGQAFLNAMHVAGNMAIMNRLACAAIALRALAQTSGGPCRSRLVSNREHNFIEARGDRVVHRKGACPADAGSPMVLPGSMGTASYVLSGTACPDALASAPHGAGRSVGRSRARTLDEGKPLRVVGRVDPRGLRHDVRSAWEATMQEEVPGAYKDVEAVLGTVVGVGMGLPVARLRPILTVKGG